MSTFQKYVAGLLTVLVLACTGLAGFYVYQSKQGSTGVAEAPPSEDLIKQAQAAIDKDMKENYNKPGSFPIANFIGNIVVDGDTLEITSSDGFNITQIHVLGKTDDLTLYSKDMVNEHAQEDGDPFSMPASSKFWVKSSGSFKAGDIVDFIDVRGGQHQYVALVEDPQKLVNKAATVTFGKVNAYDIDKAKENFNNKLPSADEEMANNNPPETQEQQPQVTSDQVMRILAAQRPTGLTDFRIISKVNGLVVNSVLLNGGNCGSWHQNAKLVMGQAYDMRSMCSKDQLISVDIVTNMGSFQINDLQFE